MRRERLLLYLSLAANVMLGICLYNLRYDYRQLGVAFADADRDYTHTRRRLEELELAAKSRATNNPALTDVEMLELARLRNEVTRLRNELRAVTNAPPAKTVAAPVKAPLTPLSVVRFTNAVTATIPLGHALVLGSWASPEPGKRLLGFMTPETTPDAPGSVLAQTRIMSVPDALLDRLGLQALRAETAANQGPAIFSAAQFATLLKTMEETEGVDVLTAPRVLAANGQAAKIAVTQAQPDGTSTGPVIHVTPTLDADGTNVRLEVNLELYFPAAKQP